MNEILPHIGKRQHSLSCFSGSVYDALKIQGIAYDEIDLFNSKNLMNLFCEGKYDSVNNDLVEIINYTLTMINIRLKNLNINNVDELKNALNAYKYLIMKINCKNLVYSEIFKKQTTRLNTHYVLIFISEDKVYVSDSLIPSNPISTYYGEIILDELQFDETTFINIDFSNFKPNKINYEKSVIGMINSYFCSNTEEAMVKFSDNIKGLDTLYHSGYEIKNVLTEMSIGLITGGAIFSRVAFASYVSKVHYIHEDLTNEVNNIYRLYHSIRLLLIKGSIKPNSNIFESISNKILVVKEHEKSILDQLYKELYRR